MSDFKARIVAELDTSKIEQQIDQLNNKNVKFNVDTGNTQKDLNGINNAINTAYKNTASFGDTLKKSLNIGSAAAITAKGFQLIRTRRIMLLKPLKSLTVLLSICKWLQIKAMKRQKSLYLATTKWRKNWEQQQHK